MDKRLVSLNLDHFDYKLVCEMERLIDINLKDYLIMDDRDYLTVTYYFSCHFLILFYWDEWDSDGEDDGKDVCVCTHACSCVCVHHCVRELKYDHS